MSWCQCLLVCHLLDENTLYHSFHTSSSSPKRGLNTDSDVLDSLALVPPETTQRLDSVALPLWQENPWKNWKHRTVGNSDKTQKIWIKGYKYSPCHVSMGDDWVFMQRFPMDSTAFCTARWKTHYEQRWTEPYLSSLDLGAGEAGSCMVVRREIGVRRVLLIKW